MVNHHFPTFSQWKGHEGIPYISHLSDPFDQGMRQSPPTAWVCDFGPATCVCRFPVWSSCLAWKHVETSPISVKSVRLATMMPRLQYTAAWRKQRNAFSDFRLYGISSKLQEFEKQGLQKVPPTGLSKQHPQQSICQLGQQINSSHRSLPLSYSVMFASNPDLCLPDVPLTLRSTGHPTVGCAACRGGCTQHAAARCATGNGMPCNHSATHS